MLCLLPFLVIGNAFLSVGSYWAVLGHRAASWERGYGSLISLEEINSHIKGQSVSGFSVTYAYEYHGKKYEGNRVCFGGSGLDQFSSIQYVSGGRELIVWIDPEKPDRSVLVPGVMYGAKVWITLGGLVDGFIIFMIPSMFRRKVPPVDGSKSHFDQRTKLTEQGREGAD